MLQKKTYIEQVHEVTRSIPYGRVSTYGAIADYLALGSARMVGWALKNSIMMDEIPAHRVVNRVGELSGRNQFPSPTYMQEMLEAEGVKVENNKVVDFKKVFCHPAEI
jgi:methylated-DNA-protein-cysteine methyltransferase-like protein